MNLKQQDRQQISSQINSHQSGETVMTATVSDNLRNFLRTTVGKLIHKGATKAEAHAAPVQRESGGYQTRDDILETANPIWVAGDASFRGRENRLLHFLANRPEVGRQELDQLTGAANSPDLVMRMRRKYGFDINTERRTVLDRDGRRTRPGWYSLAKADLPMARAFVAFGPDSYRFRYAKFRRDHGFLPADHIVLMEG